MSTPSKNSLNEDDDDDQDYIPVGVLQVSSLRKPLTSEMSQPFVFHGEEFSSRLSYDQKQQVHSPTLQKMSCNLPHLDKLDVNDIESGHDACVKDDVKNPLESASLQKDYQLPISGKEEVSKNLGREQRIQDPLQQYKILVHLMQQRAQTHGNNNEVSIKPVNLLERVGGSTSLQNVTSGATEHQKQLQKMTREDLNSNIPLESKNQLLKILGSDHKEASHDLSRGDDYILKQSGLDKESKPLVDTMGDVGAEGQNRTFQGLLGQNASVHSRDSKTDHKAQTLSHSSLSVDVTLSSQHIPNLNELSLTSLSALGHQSHPNVNHQHPEISKRLNSPVSPGRQSHSPRQAGSPRRGGSPRLTVSSPCQVVNPKQPVSPRGSNPIIWWQSQSSSPPPLHSNRASLQSGLPRQSSCPSTNTAHPTEETADSAEYHPSSQTPHLPVQLGSHSRSSRMSSDNLYHYSSHFQPIPCRPSQISPSGGIVHHRPLGETSFNQNMSSASQLSPRQSASMSSQASPLQRIPLITQKDSNSSSRWSWHQDANDKTKIDNPLSQMSMSSVSRPVVQKGENSVTSSTSDKTEIAGECFVKKSSIQCSTTDSLDSNNHETQVILKQGSDSQEFPSIDQSSLPTVEKSKEPKGHDEQTLVLTMTDDTLKSRELPQHESTVQFEEEKANLTKVVDPIIGDSITQSQSVEKCKGLNAVHLEEDLEHDKKTCKGNLDELEQRGLRSKRKKEAENPTYVDPDGLRKPRESPRYNRSASKTEKGQTPVASVREEEGQEGGEKNSDHLKEDQDFDKKSSRSKRKSGESAERGMRSKRRKGNETTSVKKKDIHKAKQNNCDSSKGREGENGYGHARESSSKRQRKPKVPFENSDVMEKEKKSEKVNGKVQQRTNERENVKKEKQIGKGSSTVAQSILTRSGLKVSKDKRQMGEKSKSVKRPGQLSVRPRRDLALKRKKLLDLRRGRGNTNQVQATKVQKRGSPTDKEMDKHQRKGRVTRKESEKAEEKDRFTQEIEKHDKVAEKEDKKFGQRKVNEIATRGSSRLLAKQTTLSENKHDKITALKLRSQLQDTSKTSDNAATERIPTRLLNLTVKPATRGMTTRQSDGTRVANKRSLEFVESLPFASRKRATSEVHTKETDDKKISDNTCTRSKSKSHKNTTLSDEDEEYDVEDDDDEEEEDSSDDRMSYNVTRSKRSRFPARKLSMSLRGEARKKKYNLIDDESISNDSGEEGKNSDLDEEMPESTNEILSDEEDKVHSDSSVGKEKKEKKEARVALTLQAKTTKSSPKLKEEGEGNTVYSSTTEQIYEPALVAIDQSKLLAFKLVPLSTEEMAETSAIEMMHSIKGYLLPGTNRLFLPSHFSKFLREEKISNPSCSETQVSSSMRTQSKISQVSIPTYTRTLVTPRPISSVKDSSYKNPAFNSPSSKPLSGEHPVTTSRPSAMRSQSSAQTPPPTVSLGLSSSSSSMASRTVSAVSSLSWNSPSLPTPPPSVSSSSSHSSSSWNAVTNLPWIPESSSSLWNNEPPANEGWRNMTRDSYGGDLAVATEIMRNSNDLFRDTSNLSPSGCIPGLGQQDISYLESNFQQDMDISSSMLLSGVQYEEGVHESVSVHRDSDNLVCSVNLDDADVGTLGNGTSTLHLPPSSLDSIDVLPSHQVGYMALKDDQRISQPSEIKSDRVEDIRLMPNSAKKTEATDDTVKVGERSSMNSRRHLYEICVVDDKKLGKCKICGNAYSLTSIYRHLKKHDNPDFGFCCSVCGKKYSQKHHLIVHMKKVHGSGSDVDPPQPEANQKEHEKLSSSENVMTSKQTTADSVPEEKVATNLRPVESRQTEPKVISEGKDGKKKARKSSGDRKGCKEVVECEVMPPDSPNAVSEESKTETLLQVERFRKMKARKKFAAQKKMSGITVDISMLEDPSSDEEEWNTEKNISEAKDTDDKAPCKDDAVNLRGQVPHQTLNETMFTTKAGQRDSKEEKAEAASLDDDKNVGDIGVTIQNQSLSSETVSHRSRIVEANMPGQTVEEDQVSAGQSLMGTPEAGKGKHPCRLCKSVLSSKCSLMMHMRRHNNEKDKFCSYCGKGFYTSQELKSHERTHTGERPFTCDICKHTFAHAGSFVVHRKSHEKKGETEPFPPEKCFPVGHPVRRRKRTVSEDEAEKQNFEQKSSPKLHSGLSFKADAGAACHDDMNKSDYRRRSLDSSLSQQSLDQNEGNRGLQWPGQSSGDGPWQDRQVVHLEGGATRNCRSHSVHTSPASTFREQSSPPFYSPNYYNPAPNNSQVPPNDHPISNQTVPSCLPLSKNVVAVANSHRCHSSSPLVSYNTTPVGSPTQTGGQGLSQGLEQPLFVSPSPRPSVSHPVTQATSPRHVNHGINSSSQPGIYLSQSPGPRFPAAVQPCNVPHLNRTEAGPSPTMSPYNIPSSYDGNCHTRTNYTANQRGSHYSYPTERSPLQALSQPAMQQQQSSSHQPLQTTQQPQVPPPLHQQGMPHGFQQLTSLPRQPQPPTRQLPPPPSRHLQQLLTQQTPPPPPYVEKKQTPPPPYPFNEFYHSQLQMDKSQTARISGSFESPSAQTFNSFKSAYNPSYFPTPTAFPSSSQSSATASSSGTCINSHSDVDAETNFSQPHRVDLPASHSFPSSSASTHPYHPHSSSSSTQNRGCFHQGPSSSTSN